LVELDPALDVEVANWVWVEQRGRDGDEVVAADDALIGKTLGQPDFNLGSDASDRSGGGRAGDRGEDGDRCVSGEHAERSSPGWWSQVGPHHVAAFYHSGAVSGASRAAAETIAGSWGSLR
jgi:hypothetical protein